jgi:DNA-binding SARP family transcriptional activator
MPWLLLNGVGIDDEGIVAAAACPDLSPTFPYPCRHGRDNDRRPRSPDERWIDRWRRRLEEVRLRGLECFAAAGLGLGGPALAQAEERARMLTELAPYRETGYRTLMEALERRGNLAEALRAYERLRILLRDELGIAPSPALQAVHRRLLLQSADS